MGTIVLIIAAVIEVALGIYCIATKSSQKKTRSWVRIGTFAAFVIFTLLSVIQWSFRWMLLAGILLVFAIVGGVSLIRNKSEKKEFKVVRVISKEITMVLIGVIAITPALLFPQYKLPEMTGQYKVSTVVYTYTDNKRIETFSHIAGNRKVTVEFWYPANADGKYPLIIFSHGAFGIKTSNTSTFRELASNGYIVCSIDHSYHALYTRDTDGKSIMADRSFIREIIDVNNGVYDEKTAYELERKWMKVRTEDMNFVLDTIIKNVENSSSNKIYQLVDTGKIGLFGHSLGGAASVQLGRERKDIDAVINLDADLLGEEVGFTDGKPVINHEIYPVPILSIYTDTMKELMAGITDPNVVIPQKLISATAPKAYEVYIKGTNHMSLTDLPLFSPFLVKMLNGSIKKMGDGQKADRYYVIQKMNSIVLEFFNSCLKGEGSFHSAGTY